MIISASRRTDIPAFYADWFVNRTRTGYCTVPNPYNRHQVSRIALAPEDVDVIVFWTRNPRPLMAHLDELDARGYRYYVQYTLLDNPRALDRNNPPLAASLRTFRELAERIGPERVIWRYDPIVFSNVTGAAFHIDAYGRIAEALRGSTSRSVISIMNDYRKLRGRMAALREEGIDVVTTDGASGPRFARLMRTLADIAAANDMTITSCAETHDLEPYGIRPGKCIDDDLIRRLFGIDVAARKDPSQRKACGCVLSRDVGMYDTCLFGCQYCYATGSFDRARAHHADHDPDSFSRSLPIAALLFILALVAVPAGAAQFSNTTAFAVDESTQVSTITISGVGIISEVSVTITFEKISAGDPSDCSALGGSGHDDGSPYNEEIYFSLTSPAGTSLVLIRNDDNSSPTYSNDDLHSGAVDVTFSPTATTVVGGPAPASGTFIPAEGSMTAFQNEDADGTWILLASDNSSSDPLCINSWSLDFTEAGGESITGPTHMDGRLNDYEAAGPIAIYPNGNNFDVYGIDPDGSTGAFTLRITRLDYLLAAERMADEPVLIEQGTIAATGQPVSVYLLPDGLVQVNTFYADGKPYVVTVDPLSDDLEHLQH